LGLSWDLCARADLCDYKQDRLIEHFVSGSTTLTAARLCGVNLETATFFILWLPAIITWELEAESEAMFGGRIKVDESYFGGKSKGQGVHGAAGKTRFLDFSSEAARSKSSLFSMPQALHRCRSLNARLFRTASSIRMVGAAIQDPVKYENAGAIIHH